MLFNSMAFAVFMTVVFLAYWFLPERYRNFAILAANVYFYLSFGVYSFIFLAIVTAVSYFGALAIADEKSKYARYGLGVSVAVCLGLLIFFKYYNFVLENLAGFLGLFSINFTPAVLKLAAPVGISFFTFKAISYVVDVKKGRIGAQKDFVKYAAYVSFFPQVASGPIERAGSFFNAIDEKRRFEADVASYALRLMAWGFFKKLIIADKLAGYAAKVFSDVEGYGGFALVVAAVLYSIQIYCDFSGYSDIANGAARLLGLDGAVNFKSPYFSVSVKEFWGRWHISLSTWLRDYIYIPLGGSRAGTFKYIRNIMVTFLVSGLWHGAAWNFVLWGGIHGLAQVIETLAKKMFPAKKEPTGFCRYFKMLLVFLFATAAWVFFTSPTAGDALYVFAHMFDGITSPVNYIKSGFSVLGINSGMLVHIVLIVAILFAFDFASLKRDVIAYIGRLPVVARYAVYVLFLDLMIIWFLQYGADSSSFVYFQF